MLRSQFLAVLGAAAAVRQTDPDVLDPAMNSPAPSGALRVLLGAGSAQPDGDGFFLFNGRRYRGRFSTASNGAIVNTVSVEAYLYGVVPREMPHSWPAAALQAQAIIARTYVLQRSSPRREYDLVPSQADQVYTGIDAERPETTRAVDATAGTVLRYGGSFAQVMYSSCCGGHTESSADAWGGAPFPYLAGVTCPYCTASPWYRWTHVLPVSSLTAAFAQLAALGDLRSVSLQAIDASGRARAWSFSGTSDTQSLAASVIRRTLGGRTVPSLLVHRAGLSDAQAGRTLQLEGSGLGHGVGFCQWGARGMALTGADARAIATFYFPGTQIRNG